MAYYIVYFNDFGKVIDVIKYSESEYSDYMARVLKLSQTSEIFQHGYF